jgi:hypothetical protein
MPDLAQFRHLLKLRVLQQDPRNKPTIQGDINIPVNRRSDEKAAMLLRVGREVCATSPERDS